MRRHRRVGRVGSRPSESSQSSQSQPFRSVEQQSGAAQPSRPIAALLSRKSQRRRLMDEALRLALDGDWSLESWLPLVQRGLRQRLRYETTAEKAVREAARLFLYLDAHGVETLEQMTPQMVIKWCWAPLPDRKGKHKVPEAATARNRRWYAQEVLKEAASLGAPVDPVALVGEIIRRFPKAVTRCLTDAECDVLMAKVDMGHKLSRVSVAVALSFAGATVTEVANVRRRDVDLVAGTVTFRGLESRTNPLCSWGADVIGRWLNDHPEVGAEDPLCVSPSTERLAAVKSVAVQLGRAMSRAGLAGLPQVAPRSIRLTEGRRVLESDGIEAAALFLGSPSLDNTALALNYRWWLRDGREVA